MELSRDRSWCRPYVSPLSRDSLSFSLDVKQSAPENLSAHCSLCCFWGSRGFVFTKMTPTETENNILLWLGLFDDDGRSSFFTHRRSAARLFTAASSDRIKAPSCEINHTLLCWRISVTFSVGSKASLNLPRSLCCRSDFLKLFLFSTCCVYSHIPLAWCVNKLAICTCSESIYAALIFSLCCYFGRVHPPCCQIYISASEDKLSIQQDVCRTWHDSSKEEFL